jgi:hypothetical protein
MLYSRQILPATTSAKGITQCTHFVVAPTYRTHLSPSCLCQRLQQATIPQDLPLNNFTTFLPELPFKNIVNRYDYSTVQNGKRKTYHSRFNITGLNCYSTWPNPLVYLSQSVMCLVWSLNESLLSLLSTISHLKYLTF